MHNNGLRARHKRRFKRTTKPSRLARRALPTRSGLQGNGGRQEVADICYVWTREDWLYAVVMDLFPRRVVGWSTGDRLHRDLALAALPKPWRCAVR